jgi:hypothetical protein
MVAFAQTYAAGVAFLARIAFYLLSPFALGRQPPPRATGVPLFVVFPPLID